MNANIYTSKSNGIFLNEDSQNFGVVVFKNNLFLKNLQTFPFHIIDGSKVECKVFLNEKDKLSFLKDKNIGNFLEKQEKHNSLYSNSYQCKKIFLGGLAPTVKEDDLMQYFSTFGQVDQAIVMKDRYTKKSRGFGFVVFVQDETVDKVMQKGSLHMLHTKNFECKPAIPKEVICNNTISQSKLGNNFFINQSNSNLTSIPNFQNFEFSGMIKNGINTLNYQDISNKIYQNFQTPFINNCVNQNVNNFDVYNQYKLSCFLNNNTYNLNNFKNHNLNQTNYESQPSNFENVNNTENISYIDHEEDFQVERNILSILEKNEKQEDDVKGYYSDLKEELNLTLKDSNLNGMRKQNEPNLFIENKVIKNNVLTSFFSTEFNFKPHFTLKYQNEFNGESALKNQSKFLN